MIALRGRAAVLFGILALVWPGLTLGALVLLYGAYALVDGVLAIIVVLRGETPHRITMALGGVVGVLAGVIAFAYPGLAALVLLYIMAAWAILTAVLQIMGAVRRRQARRQDRGVRRIEAVLDAAEAVFAEAGYEGATASAIATRARISQGSLY